jgi:hypothetical protein
MTTTRKELTKAELVKQMLATAEAIRHVKPFPGADSDLVAYPTGTEARLLANRSVML